MSFWKDFVTSLHSIRGTIVTRLGRTQGRFFLLELKVITNPVGYISANSLKVSCRASGTKRIALVEIEYFVPS